MKPALYPYCSVVKTGKNPVLTSIKFDLSLNIVLLTATRFIGLLS